MYPKKENNTCTEFFYLTSTLSGLKIVNDAILIIKIGVVSRLFVNMYHFLNFADEHSLNDNFRNLSRKLVQGGVIRYTEGASIRYSKGASIRYRTLRIFRKRGGYKVQLNFFGFDR